MPSKSVDLVVTDPPYIVRYRDRAGRSVATAPYAAFISAAGIDYTHQLPQLPRHRPLRPRNDSGAR